MRVTCVIGSLQAGGAERVMSILADALVSAGDQVELVTLAAAGSDFYAVDPRVRRSTVSTFHRGPAPIARVLGIVTSIISLRRHLRHRRPDVALSFIDRTNVLTLLAAAGTGIPVVVSERVDPRAHETDSFTSIGRRVTYRHAASLIVQSRELRTWSAGFITPTRVTVLPNPVRPLDVVEPRRRSGHDILQLGVMGRLDRQKGIDILFRALAELPVHVHWRLDVVGDGRERDQLTKLADDLGIARFITWHGTLRDPESVIGRADIFVLPSRYEGFPNALLEAMSMGLACIAADCPTGPGEMIDDGVDGVLVAVGDAEALRDAIVRLATNDDERRAIARAAPGVRERLRLADVADRWRTHLRESSRGPA